MIEIGNLVRITRGQGWNAEEDPGVGIVTDVRKQYPLLDEIKVLWTKNGNTLWENSGKIRVISRA